MARYFIGIDVSTTASKVIAVDDLWGGCCRPLPPARAFYSTPTLGRAETRASGGTPPKPPSTPSYKSSQHVM
jgi:hypothetical protein